MLDNPYPEAFYVVKFAHGHQPSELQARTVLDYESNEVVQRSLIDTMLSVLISTVYLDQNRLAKVGRQGQDLAKLFVKLFSQLLAVYRLDEE